MDYFHIFVFAIHFKDTDMTNSVATFTFEDGSVLNFDTTWDDDDGFIHEGEDIAEDVYFSDQSSDLKHASIKMNDSDIVREIHFQSEVGTIHTYPIT